MSCNFYFIFQKNHMFLRVLNGVLLFWTLWVFLLGFSNQKMISTTLNTSFHIDLRRFVGDEHVLLNY